MNISGAQPESLNDDALVPLLKEEAVPMENLHQSYGSLLELVRILIGVVPNCDPYLEIWPPAFRTYNLMVPNFLNLPFSILGFGSAPKDILGLAMYIASRTAECPYCSAHTCSFAIRRGADPAKIAAALTGASSFTKEELATIEVARSLAEVPCLLTDAKREKFEKSFSPANREWIVLAISMMGFLNKFMDAIGVELETSTLSEVKHILGDNWSAGKAGRFLDPKVEAKALPPADSLHTKILTLRFAPKAIQLDKRWQHGIPNTWPDAGQFLKRLTGHEFAVLARLRHKRAIRAITTILRDNLNPEQTIIGLKNKTLAGVVFATIVQNKPLVDEACALAKHQGNSNEEISLAARFAANEDLEPATDNRLTGAALILAKAASPSPAKITTNVVSAFRKGGIQPAAIVEIITWLSVLQMLHRLSSYYPAR